MNEKRTDRLSSAVQKAVSDILQFKLKATKEIGFLTVTGAEVTNDLSYAYIYVSIINDKNGEKFENLQKYKNFVRKEIVKEVKMRKVPEVIFKIDKSIDNYLHVEELLKK